MGYCFVIGKPLKPKKILLGLWAFLSFITLLGLKLFYQTKMKWALLAIISKNKETLIWNFAAQLMYLCRNVQKNMACGSI